MGLANKPLLLTGLRGATTCKKNTVECISSAVEELVDELVKRNELIPKNIISITFSVTPDLDACFPAGVARRKTGWESIALIDCQQMKVEGDLKNCIRILAHVLLPRDVSPQHPYLHEASLLRPDRTNEKTDT